VEPVPEDEVKFLLEEEDTTKENKKESRGAEALEILRQMEDSPVEVAPMMPAAPAAPPPAEEPEVTRGQSNSHIPMDAENNLKYLSQVARCVRYP
jgi:hypothetical protein